MAYHRQWIDIGRGGRIPLGHYLARRAGKGAEFARQTLLIRAHGPSPIRHIGCNRNQTGIGRERTSGVSFLHSFLSVLDMEVVVIVPLIREMFQVMTVAMLRKA